MRIHAFLITIVLLSFFSTARGQMQHDPKMKIVHLKTADGRLALTIDYAQGAKIGSLVIDGKSILAPAGIYSAVNTTEHTWTSWNKPHLVTLSSSADQIVLEGIMLGEISESWTFATVGDKILWTISRTYPKDLLLEDMAMPRWNFADLKTWKGGILSNGGMVWCKYLSAAHDTYGVHTGGVTFWNEQERGALKVTVQQDEEHAVAAKYSQQVDGTFSYTTLVSDAVLKQRYHLSRFVAGKQDVFAPFVAKKGKVSLTLALEYVNYPTVYGRGHLPGIDAVAVRELMNTTGRYGVVDNNIVGANGWLTNWKCLHEPFFAQIGLALNDKNYTENLAATLDQERDLAVLEDGRVLSRWHDVPGDEITDTYNSETGYYEAKWGYTVDSQTGYIINTTEQFHQTGDLLWLSKHKETCERALDWLIRRDTDGNGIFEMVNQNTAEQKASDWIDIVWASYENAFVNAQLYEALNLWSACEKVLGDPQKSRYYAAVAVKLKHAFNKSVHKGGFWHPEKQQYIYWRDRDGTPRGDNLVTPVNFAAIAYGLCDDQNRIDTILNNIERRTAAEGLFHWPLVFDSFKREEVHSNNWPFPNYENGDIFPTWGYLGIRSYVKFNKDLALKYIHNILAQYRKDGLSSQRYSRVDQKGLGTDILSGISTTVTALYSDIYGVRPQWNRMGLEPNMTDELNGTRFEYTLRDTLYKIELNVDDYQLRTTDFVVKSNASFGVGTAALQLIYYPGNKDEMKLVQMNDKSAFTELQVTNWKDGLYQWASKGTHVKQFVIHGLRPGKRYQLVTAAKQQQKFTVPKGGMLTIPASGKGAQSYTLREI